MKRFALVAAASLLVLLLAAGTALAASAKVTGVEGEKATLAVKGGGFKGGDQVTLKAGDDSVSGTVSSASGDTVVVQLKRKAAFVAEGKAVTIDKKSSAAMQGC